MKALRPDIRRMHSGLASGRRIVIAGVAGALFFGCNLDGGEPGPEAQLQPAAGTSTATHEGPPVSAAPETQPQPSAGAAPELRPDQRAEIDQLRDENRQLLQALDVTLANQQDLANQLRKTNEALVEIRSDVALVRERLRDLELAQESHPLLQRPAGAAAVAQQR
jgi:small-conductance mechanosensitive channel